MNIAQELRQCANAISGDRPDIANRILHAAMRVARLELQLDDIAADGQQAERLRQVPPARPRLRLVPNQ